MISRTCAPFAMGFAAQKKVTGFLLPQLHFLDASVIADQLHFISLGIDYIKRAPMYPRVFGGDNLKPQCFQSLFFASEIYWVDLECDVVNRRGRGVDSAVARIL